MTDLGWGNILEMLAKDSDEDVRLHIAGNKSTPAQILSQLANDSQLRVRGYVARNPSTPTQILSQLANDSQFHVRRGVARNPSTPVQILSQFANDSQLRVRGYVARNPSTPVQILSELANDSDDDVRRSVARNPSTPAQILSQLADDSAWFVRRSVAGNPSTPTQILSQLANDSDDYVRRSVAGNLTTPLVVLEVLSRDPMSDVRRAVASNKRRLQSHDNQELREEPATQVDSAEPQTKQRRLIPLELPSHKDSEPATLVDNFDTASIAQNIDSRRSFDGHVADLATAVSGLNALDLEELATDAGYLEQILTDPIADPIEINNAAWRLDKDGLFEEAMSGFDRAASMGQPNALSTLLWKFMLMGQAERAITAFEAYFPRVAAWMDMQDFFEQEQFYPQLANNKSNAGLAYAAMGQTHMALTLWQEAADEDHAEAKVYPAVMAARDGHTRQATKLLKRVPDYERAKVRRDMEQVLEEGSGWFQSWGRDALILLDSI